MHCQALYTKFLACGFLEEIEGGGGGGSEWTQQHGGQKAFASFSHLQDLVGSGRVLLRPNAPQHGEYLVDNLAGDEAAEVQLDVLHEGHPQQGDPRLDSRQDVAVPGQRVVCNTRI